MELRTAFVIATLLMLANGAVLGLMQRDLPASLRPAAVSWQVGTLLAAAGCAMYALEQLDVPLAPLLTVANGTIFLGLTAYWHALRLFYGYRPTLLLLAPAAVGTLGIFLFIAVWQNAGVRILIATTVWLIVLGGSWLTLKAQAGRDTAQSRRVLLVIFAGVALFTAFRGLYFLLAGVAPRFSVADPAAWMNKATPMVATILPVIGTTAFVLMCSERIRRQWENAASTDYLTGLPNRRTLTQAGAARFAAEPAPRGAIALAVVDIDGFKTINDGHGHDIGDFALKHVAQCLAAAVGGAEMLARLGGEEFVVLVPGEADAARAVALGERLRAAVEDRPFVADALSLTITASVGVAVRREDDTDFHGLLRRADRALYAAKAQGRNRVELAP